MKRSHDRILTTHTGSLPRVETIRPLLEQREREGHVDARAFERAASEATREVVERQLATGLDVINDGEQSKASYATYVVDRLTGFEGARELCSETSRDSNSFAEFTKLVLLTDSKFSPKGGSVQSRMYGWLRN